MGHLSLSLFRFSLRYFLTHCIEHRSIQRRECHDLAEGTASGSLTRDLGGLGGFGLVVINPFGNVTHEISHCNTNEPLASFDSQPSDAALFVESKRSSRYHAHMFKLLVQ